jgi:hypothetical protein
MRTEKVTETLSCERTEGLAMSQPLDVKMMYIYEELCTCIRRGIYMHMQEE